MSVTRSMPVWIFGLLLGSSVLQLAARASFSIQVLVLTGLSLSSAAILGKMALDSIRDRMVYGWITSGKHLKAKGYLNGKPTIASVSVNGQPIRLTVESEHENTEMKFSHVQDLAAYLETNTEIRLRDFKVVANK